MSLARHTLPAAAVLALVIVASGCGREREADLADGKTLFVQKCGSCHKLGRANTQGVTGPSLDTAFRSALAAGMNRRTVRGIVRRQIAHPRRGSVMPANLVMGNRAADVAAYVAMVTGRPGQDTGALAQAGKPKTSSKPVREAAGKLQIDADPTGALAFISSRAVAKAGKVTFAMANKAQIQHDIAVEGPGGNELGKGPVVSNGGTSRFTATLKPGKYTFLCTVPGHAAGGMKGTLTVQ